MTTLWFCLVAFMLTAYVVFDGFDLGAGILHTFVAHTSDERAEVFGSIGPVWDGNEVWIIAGGGVLYFAFPLLYASSFSGFYVPLILVLWLLVGRGIAIELRHQIAIPMWATFWDAVFSVSSLLLAVFFGAALGNVVRGVPLDAHARFFLPLWTDLDVRAPVGVLDWYTVLVAVAAAVALALHGALWLTYTLEGEVARRARRLSPYLLVATLVTMSAVTATSWAVQPHIAARFLGAPWGFAFPALAVVGLVAILWFRRRGADGKAFLASCLYLVGMLTSVAYGLYPWVLPERGGAGSALTITNASASASSLAIGLAWFIPGMALVAAYVVLAYRRFAGKVGAAGSPD